MIDYDAIARAGPRAKWLGKGTPLRTLIKDAKTKWQERDERESDKVRARSGGRCEVTIRGIRCRKRAFHVHHHKGGFGVRGRGDSALRKHKTHACADCHSRITGKTLVHVRGNRYRER